MLILVLFLCAGYVFAVWLPRLAVASIASILAAMLAGQFARTTRLFLQHSHRDLDYDRRPARAQRRAMRASLRLALNRTELRSLLPCVVARVDGRAA
jgi:hypothetical protein